MPKTNIKTKKSKTELPQKRGEEEKLFSSPAESRNGGTKVKKSAKKNVSSFVSSLTRRSTSSSISLYAELPGEAKAKMRL